VIDAAPLEAVSAWAEHYRPIWETSFDRMDDYLQQLASTPTPANNRPNNPKDRTKP